MTKNSLKDYQGDDQVISAIEMDLKLQEQPDFILKVFSRIPTLDKYIEGFRDGELYVISGATKQGKTLLAQSFSNAFIKQQIFPLWFSYEVSARQFISQFEEIPQIYLPATLKPHSMDWVEDRIVESFLKYHTRAIFIDHLHFLFDMARVRSPSLEIGTVVRRLKTIAINNNMLVFLLCHTTKGKSDEHPTYESLRDSSFISSESDCVLMIKRIPKEGNTWARVSVEFHRRTGVLEKTVNLEKIGSYLRELTQKKSTENYSEDRRFV